MKRAYWQLTVVHLIWEVLSSIPSWSTMIHRFLCRLYAFPCVGIKIKAKNTDRGTDQGALFVEVVGDGT